MNQEELLKNFINVLIQITKLSIQLEDSFFANKLGNRISKFIRSFIDYCVFAKNAKSKDELGFYKLLIICDTLAELAEEMVYLGFLNFSVTVPEAKKNLLIFKLNLIRYQSQILDQEVNKNTIEKTNDRQETNSVVKKSKKFIKLNLSKQKILSFIKTYPDIRTKDIISEFSALSDRTVKRNLTELLRIGIIKKRVDNKATHYSYTGSESVR